MGELMWSSDSDETVVEGSVTESDVEDEEFRRRRFRRAWRRGAGGARAALRRAAPKPRPTSRRAKRLKHLSHKQTPPRVFTNVWF